LCAAEAAAHFSATGNARQPLPTTFLPQKYVRQTLPSTFWPQETRGSLCRPLFYLKITCGSLCRAFFGHRNPAAASAEHNKKRIYSKFEAKNESYMFCLFARLIVLWLSPKVLPLGKKSNKFVFSLA
jgi:hypothetical protein